MVGHASGQIISRKSNIGSGASGQGTAGNAKDDINQKISFQSISHVWEKYFYSISLTRFNLQ